MKKISNFSIVIPVFNEEQNIISLLEEIKRTLQNKLDYEILIVDDGSDDNTVNNIRKKIRQFHNLKLILHRSNYGQSVSLQTGISNAKYELIVTLDGDGQNDPKDIMKLIKRFKQSSPFFLVIGNRRKRNDKLTRIIASRFAYKIRSLILNDNVPDTGCALKVFKKKDFLFIPFFNHIHRFLPFIFSTMGGETISVDVNHRKRKSGVSKYSNLQRAMVGIYDLFGVIWLRKRTHSSILIRKVYTSKK